jgi:hypothetical protein
LVNFGFEVFLKGALRKPKSKQRWNEDDIAKLKAMAGKEPGDRIAAELGRTLGATAVQASKRGLSLRIKYQHRGTKPDEDGSSAESVL